MPVVDPWGRTLHPGRVLHPGRPGPACVRCGTCRRDHADMTIPGLPAGICPRWVEPAGPWLRLLGWVGRFLAWLTR